MAAGQVTPLKTVPVDPEGVGLVTIDQLVPFQRSITVTVFAAVVADPTAKQFVVLVHATPLKTVPVAAAGFGLATTDQLVPFHRSTSDDSRAVVETKEPTAKHSVVVGHATCAS